MKLLFDLLLCLQENKAQQRQRQNLFRHLHMGQQRQQKMAQMQTTPMRRQYLQR